MKQISIILFIIVTAIHLFASLKKNKKIRNISKPFILLSLFLFYIFSVDKPQPSVILALLFSWIGDLLLIPPGLKWFTAGGISFMISHFFFALSYLKEIDFNRVNILYIVVLVLFYMISVYYIFDKLKPHLPESIFIPMVLYLLINGMMNCFAIFRYITSPSLYRLITVAGALLFFISDTCLFFVRFDKNSKLKTHFLIMLTYSIGEFLIVLGLILK